MVSTDMNNALCQLWDAVLQDDFHGRSDMGLVLLPLDVETGRLAQAQAPGKGPVVPLAAALLSHAARQGHTCLSLKQLSKRLAAMKAQWQEACPLPDHGFPEESMLEKAILCPPHPSVHKAGATPSPAGAFLILEEDRLYLRRFWAWEEAICDFIKSRQSPSLAPSHDPSPGASPSQQQAIQKALCCLAAHPLSSVGHPFFILTGGPGTGKTWTVLRILQALQKHHQGSLKIALAASTGKAAARLKEAIDEGKNPQLQIATGIAEDTHTLHRLLGASQDGTSFRHHEKNPLRLDLLVIDEASMVDLGLMARTIAALPPHAGLMLVGDKNQLASVEAGSVFADLCFPNAPYAAALTENYRVGEKPSLLALIEALRQEKGPEDLLGFFKPFWVSDQTSPEGLEKAMEDGYRGYFDAVDRNEDPLSLFRQFSKFQVLCPHREGRHGAEELNGRLEKTRLGKLHARGTWYPGRAVMITRNHYGLGLFNGDIGLALRKEGRMRVFFKVPGGCKDLSPSRLPAHEMAFAMTVHKSQGSEFDQVMLVLPEKGMDLLSRELLYTAVSRARNGLFLHGSLKVLHKALEQGVDRASGLTSKLMPHISPSPSAGFPPLG